MLLDFLIYVVLYQTKKDICKMFVAQCLRLSFSKAIHIYECFITFIIQCFMLWFML